MKKLPFPFVVSAIALLAAFVAFAIWGIPYFFSAPAITPSGDGYGSETIRARVDAIIEEGQISLGDNRQMYQIMRVEILEGTYQGILIEVDYGKRQLRPDAVPFSTGDEMYVIINKNPDGLLTAYYVDYVRTNALLILVGVFVAGIVASAAGKVSAAYWRWPSAC